MIDIRPFDAEIDEYHELRCAVYRMDYPELSPPTRAATVSQLGTPSAQLGERLMWRARLDGRLAGVSTCYLPVDGNDHVGIVNIVVHPDCRRRGVATKLLGIVEPMLRARGRTVIEGTHVTEDGAGGHWTRARGFRVVHTAINQILDLDDVDRGRWEVAVPELYRLVHWSGDAPEHLVESYAQARTAIGDAPHGFATPDWTVDRVRRIEAEQAERGVECRTVVAVDSAGEVVGLTELELRPLNPARLFQGDTAVLAAHRGHGLGLAMKAAMLRWFVPDRPAAREVWTSTGATNVHMAEVNHRLGFRTVLRSSAVKREL
ncbi:GNAT family N-acetyltransferase [Kutzneria sp. NPDC052558]|uniref:GNAT family N-acetyltransferase n=1 Tax=Kutzneria sp. NPDC052558 TaxID=3364121 RepID=UPI0037CC5295